MSYFTTARMRAKERALRKSAPELIAPLSIRCRSFIARHPKAYGAKFHRRAILG